MFLSLLSCWLTNDHLWSTRETIVCAPQIRGEGCDVIVEQGLRPTLQHKLADILEEQLRGTAKSAILMAEDHMSVFTTALKGPLLNQDWSGKDRLLCLLWLFCDQSSLPRIWLTCLHPRAQKSIHSLFLLDNYIQVVRDWSFRMQDVLYFKKCSEGDGILIFHSLSVCIISINIYIACDCDQSLNYSSKHMRRSKQNLLLCYSIDHMSTALLGILYRVTWIYTLLLLL